MKKLISKILTICILSGMLTAIVPQQSVNAANTTGSFRERIVQLQNKFPSGKYWNHMGSSANNPNGYTSTPCTHHGNCSRNGYNGWCGCNSFNNQSIQCFGFAEKLAYDVFGTNPSRTWTKSYNLSAVKPGDIIRYKNNGHSIFVTAVTGSTITFADCNSDGHCKIRWNVTMNKSDVWGLSYIHHANNYNDIMSISSDTEAPVIVSSYISEVHADGYTITATVSDNVAVTSVRCATWTYNNDQDDLIWQDMSLSGNTATVYVKFADHGNQIDYYNNHIYVYDSAGNYSAVARDYTRCEDIGTDFYAKITNIELGKVVINQDGNAVSGSDATDASRLWKFERQSGNRYKIVSCLDGSVLDVDNFRTEDGANIFSYTSNDGDNQRWYIARNGNGFCLTPAYVQGKALDVAEKSSAEGANIQLYTWGDKNGAQIFRFDKVTDISGYYGKMTSTKMCNETDFVTEVSTFTEGDTLYLDVAYQNASGFYIKLQKDNQVLLENTLPAGKYKYPNLLTGNYSIEFVPQNYLSTTSGKVTKTFTVKKPVQEEIITTPEETKKPEVVTKPEEAVKPETQTKPEETVKPETQTKPEETVKPETEAKPEEAVKPGVATKPQEDTEQKETKGGLKIVTTKKNSIKLTWKKVEGASGYILYRYKGTSNKAAKKITIKKGSKTVYTDKKLKEATTYRYKVRAYFKKNGKKTYGEYSDIVTGNTTMAVPKLQAVGVKWFRQTGLIWNRTKNANGYEIYRSTELNGDYTKIATVNKSKLVNAYTDKNLTKSTCYYYKIRAYKEVDGQTVYSDYSAVKKVQM